MLTLPIGTPYHVFISSKSSSVSPSSLGLPTQELMQSALQTLFTISSHLSKSHLSPILKHRSLIDIEECKDYIRELLTKYHTDSKYLENQSFKFTFTKFSNSLNEFEEKIRSGKIGKLLEKLRLGEKGESEVTELLLKMNESLNQLKQVLYLIYQADNGYTDFKNQAFDKDVSMAPNQQTTNAEKGANLNAAVPFNNLKECLVIKSLEQTLPGAMVLLTSLTLDPTEIHNIPGQKLKLIGSKVHIKRLFKAKPVYEISYNDFTSSISKHSFLSEVTSLYKLSSCPFILKLHGVHVEPQSVSLVTEYTHFGSLDQVIGSIKLMEDGIIRSKFTISILAGINFLHENRTVHGNISTACILVTECLQVKISGFEYSKGIGNTKHENSTVNNVSPDDVRWLAPEQIDNPENLSKFSDVYSTALVIWSLWSNLLPYYNINNLSIQKYILNGQTEDLTIIPASLTDDLKACWLGKPSLRPSSRELLRSLETILSITESACKEEYFNAISLISTDAHEKNAAPSTNSPLIQNAFEFNSPRDSYERMLEAKTLEVESILDTKRILLLAADDLEQALYLHSSNKKKEAFDKFQALASFGSIQAFYYLGYYYYWGVENVVSKNIVKGVDYFELAATSGSSDAMDHLGIHFIQKSDKNPAYLEKAVRYFEKACKLENPKGEFHLGNCYLKGRGVPRDRNKGLELINNAAKKGHNLAKVTLLKLQAQV